MEACERRGELMEVTHQIEKLKTCQHRESSPGCHGKAEKVGSTSRFPSTSSPQGPRVSHRFPLFRRLRAQLCVGGSDAKAAAGALRRLGGAEAPPVPLHLVAATPGRLRALLQMADTPLNMTLGNGEGRG